MATWLDIARENYDLAKQIEPTGRFRGAINRYYYAAFQLITAELIAHGAGPPFGKNNNWHTPRHYELPDLIDRYLSHLSGRARNDLKIAVQNLRRRREAADYTIQMIDESFVREAHRYTEQIIRYVGVNL